MSAGIITNMVQPRLLLSDVVTLFGLAYNQLPDVDSLIYEKKSSDSAYEEALMMVGSGAASLKSQGGAVQLSTISGGPARRTDHEVWAKRLRITQEAFDDMKQMAWAKELSADMAKGLWHSRQQNGAKLFNNLTSTSAPYAGIDGAAPLSASHVYGNSGSFSNLATGDISSLALENADIAVQGWTDQSGLLIKVGFKALLIPPALKYDVQRILKSDKQPGEFSNDTNALADMGTVPKVISWNFLTDTDQWVLLTDVAGLVYYSREGQKPRYYQNEETLDHIYMMTERYSHDYYNPQAIYGSVGS